MANDNAVAAPKSKNKGVPLGAELLPKVRGVFLVENPDGWRAVEVEIPANQLGAIVVRQTEADMLPMAQAEGERMLHDIGRVHRVRQEGDERSSGLLTPVTAMQRLRKLCAELRTAYWADAIEWPAAVASLRAFAITGRLTEPSIEREPTGDDRLALQQLAGITGAWPKEAP